MIKIIRFIETAVCFLVDLFLIGLQILVVGCVGLVFFIGLVMLLAHLTTALIGEPTWTPLLGTHQYRLFWGSVLLLAFLCKYNEDYYRNLR